MPTVSFGEIFIPFTFQSFSEYAFRRPRYSSGCCFGSLYLRSNIKRFIEGNLHIPSISNSKNSFPKYFRRKIREYLCPLVFYRTHLRGSHSFSKGCVPIASKAFFDFGKAISELGCISAYHLAYKIPFVNSASMSVNYDLIHTISSSKFHLYRHDTKEHLYFYYNGFFGFTYNRSQRKFINNGTFYSLPVLARSYLEQEDSFRSFEADSLLNFEYQTMLYNLLLSSSFTSFWRRSVSLEDLKWSQLHNKSLNRIFNDNSNLL